ncbi:hypothetical protein CEXT_280741 [Caerostris extrusa]|uniref:Uncharacterized protein n=1 Tax=Caerostris extrusa TaxID=172846 RepID=A0AAV4P1E6_CAEEX|nr:hypothetical protein CEXT_280741 [Caerostris extrusa]
MSLNSNFGSSPPSATVAVGRKGIFPIKASRVLSSSGHFHHCRKREKEDRRKGKKKISLELQSKEIEDVINGIESDEDLGDHGGISRLEKEEKEDRRKGKKKISLELQSKEIEDVINGIESDEDLGDHGVSVVWVCFFFFLIPFDLFRPGRRKKVRD